MTTLSPTFAPAAGNDWKAAFSALRRLLSNANDTAQVFRIMRALNAGSAKAGYDRLLRTGQGGRVAWQRAELAEKLSDPAFVAQFPEASVGAAYAAFLADTGHSAQGLAAVSQTIPMLGSAGARATSMTSGIFSPATARTIRWARHVWSPSPSRKPEALDGR